MSTAHIQGCGRGCSNSPLVLFPFLLFLSEEVLAQASAPPESASSSALRWSSLARLLARRCFISSSAVVRSVAVVLRVGARLLGPSSSKSSSSSSSELVPATRLWLRKSGI